MAALHSAEQNLREVLEESMRLNGDLRKKDRLPIAQRTAVSVIDPKEFGQLQAQVQALIESDREKTELLHELTDHMNAIRLQMAEARGGWKAVLAIGGASAGLGSIATWLLSHLAQFFGKGSP